MKIKIDFITNSSSTCQILFFPKDFDINKYLSPLDQIGIGSLFDTYIKDLNLDNGELRKAFVETTKDLFNMIYLSPEEMCHTYVLYDYDRIPDILLQHFNENDETIRFLKHCLWQCLFELIELSNVIIARIETNLEGDDSFINITHAVREEIENENKK